MISMLSYKPLSQLIIENNILHVILIDFKKCHRKKNVIEYVKVFSEKLLFYYLPSEK